MSALSVRWMVPLFGAIIVACSDDTNGAMPAPVLAPTVTLNATTPVVVQGMATTLTWTTTEATVCTASGAWSGARATSGSASTGALTVTSTFVLTCTGPGGSAREAVTVTVSTPPPPSGTTGLDFQGSSGSGYGTVRFKFTNPLAIYPATYIWKVYPRQQQGYYTTFFWGNDDGKENLDTFLWDGGNANTFYGAHPYPIYPATTTHKWEIATDQQDIVGPEFVVYNRWYSQALIAWSDAAGKHTVFYWDLPDMSKVIVHVAPTSSGNKNPPSPALTWGDAPWNPGYEVMNGVIRGIQIYATRLTDSEVLSELTTPLTTSAGASKVWYMNLNPTPTDITDKSGGGHQPAWVGSGRPLLWTGP